MPEKADETPILAEVLLRALTKDHPSDMVADALLIAAAQAERERKKPRSRTAQEAFAELAAALG